eukprot:TRINITY_DN6190_c0_g1_i1.p1 TRINITY_DN6190_c0_g1~~TRINITY_DN6190_c0_g1_i1.p1  ORF type:complete len:945 (+),score=102.08 TRINITY_DN6190_c0_g1_i1:36-2870(+)
MPGDLHGVWGVLGLEEIERSQLIYNENRARLALCAGVAAVKAVLCGSKVRSRRFRADDRPRTTTLAEHTLDLEPDAPDPPPRAPEVLPFAELGPTSISLSWAGEMRRVQSTQSVDSGYDVLFSPLSRLPQSSSHINFHHAHVSVDSAPPPLPFFGPSALLKVGSLRLNCSLNSSASCTTDTDGHAWASDTNIPRSPVRPKEVPLLDLLPLVTTLPASPVSTRVDAMVQACVLRHTQYLEDHLRVIVTDEESRDREALDALWPKCYRQAVLCTAEAAQRTRIIVDQHNSWQSTFASFSSELQGLPLALTHNSPRNNSLYAEEEPASGRSVNFCLRQVKSRLSTPRSAPPSPVVRANSAVWFPAFEGVREAEQQSRWELEKKESQRRCHIEILQADVQRFRVHRLFEVQLAMRRIESLESDGRHQIAAEEQSYTNILVELRSQHRQNTELWRMLLDRDAVAVPSRFSFEALQDTEAASRRAIFYEEDAARLESWQTHILSRPPTALCCTTTPLPESPRSQIDSTAENPDGLSLLEFAEARDRGMEIHTESQERLLMLLQYNNETGPRLLHSTASTIAREIRSTLVERGFLDLYCQERQRRTKLLNKENEVRGQLCAEMTSTTALNIIKALIGQESHQRCLIVDSEKETIESVVATENLFITEFTKRKGLYEDEQKQRDHLSELAHQQAEKRLWHCEVLEYMKSLRADLDQRTAIEALRRADKEQKNKADAATRRRLKGSLEMECHTLVGMAQCRQRLMTDIERLKFVDLCASERVNRKTILASEIDSRNSLQLAHTDECAALVKKVSRAESPYPEANAYSPLRVNRENTLSAALSFDILDALEMHPFGIDTEKLGHPKPWRPSSNRPEMTTSVQPSQKWLSKTKKSQTSYLAPSVHPSPLFHGATGPKSRRGRGQPPGPRSQLLSLALADLLLKDQLPTADIPTLF